MQIGGIVAATTLAFGCAGIQSETADKTISLIDPASGMKHQMTITNTNNKPSAAITDILASVRGIDGAMTMSQLNSRFNNRAAMANAVREVSQK